MQFRPATTDDTPTIETFLRRYTDTSMFLLSNLRAFGPCGGEAPHATRVWLLEDADRLQGVVGLSTAGSLLVQLPNGAPEGSLRTLLAGETVKAIFGETAQVGRARAALGLDAARVQLDDDEPLYSLDLDHLFVPSGATRLRPAGEGDRTRLIAWREEYLVETVRYSPEDAIEAAPEEIDGMLARGTLMLLEQPDGTPCAMTSFNALLPETVQIGNVFTPDDFRGRGYARRAVALHLERARAEGVQRAILFASGAAASRAYEAIGFDRIGRFALLIFGQAQDIGGTA
ncbi:GNAT family N-acetyltransferase [Tropicimonas isoalkanivorans]|uniref:Acetyltransferase (GNAT) family protein n=1 Tax=Tropicimonas isoalkanivorans TaxID=441112 RepID=A0A1I1NEF6_9RHOB|nr:GNAT family N-acetyltransferase [Tropicimonas isoalkanivorans]SFC93153.1 Acetyltransferase (GNAT) family protein [Tropicimonas isoalkanivorans]